MAKNARKTYLELSVKASAITGAAFGFVLSLLVYAGGGMMGSGMMYGYGAGGGLLLVVTQTLLWALLSAAGAAIYNLALKK